MKRYKSIVFTFLRKNSSDGNIRRTPRKYAKAEIIQEFRPTLTSRTEWKQCKILEYFIYDVVGTKITILMRKEK